jgi:hypothetical protein
LQNTDRLKPIITILLLFWSFELSYGQNKISEKIIGTWVGPLHEKYDSVQLKNVSCCDTLILFKDHGYKWTGEKDGTWQISSPGTAAENYELNMSGYYGLDAIRQGNNAEQRHPFEILKLTRRELKLRTFISWDERDFISWRTYEFTKI